MSQNNMSCNGVPSAFSPSSFMWQIQSLHEGNQQPTNSLIPTNPFSNPQDLRGAMAGKRSRSFSGVEGEDDILDDEWHSGEKKRRLNLEQVRTLEKSFETGSRLEPERKMQLARALGLRPRQIAIWFQNRRARWKTKQLEKDYDALKKQFDALKSENESIQAHNKKLQAEILSLKGRETSEPINLNKEIEGSCSENSCGINLDISRAADSTLNSKQCRSLFRSYRPGSTNHNSEIQCPKIESTTHDESFGNMFCNMDDQSAFWSWSENHNFH